MAQDVTIPQPLTSGATDFPNAPQSGVPDDLPAGYSRPVPADDLPLGYSRTPPVTPKAGSFAPPPGTPSLAGAPGAPPPPGVVPSLAPPSTTDRLLAHVPNLNDIVPLLGRTTGKVESNLQGMANQASSLTPNGAPVIPHQQNIDYSSPLTAARDIATAGPRAVYQNVIKPAVNSFRNPDPADFLGQLGTAALLSKTGAEEGAPEETPLNRLQRQAAKTENPVAMNRYTPEGNNFSGVMRSNSHFDMPAEAARAVPAMKEAASDLGVNPDKDFKGMNGPVLTKRIIEHAIDINEARNKASIDPVRSQPADVSKTPELAELLGKKNPTVGDVDAFRLEANKKLSKSGYYGQSPSQQYSAGPDLAKLETAAGQARDTVYDSVQQHTGVDLRPQKAVEAALIKTNDVANSTNNTLAQQEAKYQSTPMSKRIAGSIKRIVSIKANPTNAFEAGVSSPTDEFNSNMQKVFQGGASSPGSVMKNGKLVNPPGQTGPVNFPQYNLNLTGTPPPAPATQNLLNFSQEAHPEETPGAVRNNIPAVDRRAVDRSTMSANELEAAIKNRGKIRTPFDYTEDARQTMLRDQNTLGSEEAQRGRAAEVAQKYPGQRINPIRDPFAAPEQPVTHNMITDASGKPDRLEIMKGNQPLGHLKIEEQIPGTWTVKDAVVNQPGKGYGSSAYKQLISEAQKAGVKTIESDISNTSGAAKTWKSLQREFPNAVTEENGQYSMDTTKLKK